MLDEPRSIGKLANKAASAFNSFACGGKMSADAQLKHNASTARSKARAAAAKKQERAADVSATLLAIDERLAADRRALARAPVTLPWPDARSRVCAVRAQPEEKERDDEPNFVEEAKAELKISTAFDVSAQEALKAAQRELASIRPADENDKYYFSYGELWDAGELDEAWRRIHQRDRLLLAKKKVEGAVSWANFQAKMRRRDEAELERCEEFERWEARQDKKRERERELRMAERATEVEDERGCEKRAKEGDAPEPSYEI